MSLRDRAASIGKNETCPVGAASELLDDEDRAWLEEQLALPKYDRRRKTYRELADLVSDETSVSVTDWHLLRHKGRSCKCHRGER